MPCQIKTHSIRSAHDNIDKTLKAAEGILTQFDQTRMVSLCFSLSLFSINFRLTTSGI